MLPVREVKKRSLDRYLWITLVVDLVSKALARKYLVYQVNGGVGWGISLGNYSLILVIVGIGILLWWFKGSWWERLLLYGGLGNIIDRVVNGGVTDFINLFGLWINLADIMISVAVIGAIISFIDGRNKDSLRESRGTGDKQAGGDGGE